MGKHKTKVRKKVRKKVWRKIRARKTTPRERHKKEWSKSVRRAVRIYHKIKIRPTPWKHYRPEPDIKGRTRILRKNLDVVKMGGVGRTFSATRIAQSIKRIRFRKGTTKELYITGYAVGKNGRRIKDKKVKLRIGLDKGRNRMAMVNKAFERLNQQINAFSWKVSPSARKNRKARGQSIRSLKIDIRLSEVS